MNILELEPITKAPWEGMFRTCQFKRPDGQGWLDSTVIANAEVTVEAWPGGTAIPEMVERVSPYAETQVRYWISGGQAGRSYLIRIRITDSNGQKFEARLRLKVG